MTKKILLLKKSCYSKKTSFENHSVYVWFSKIFIYGDFEHIGDNLSSLGPQHDFLLKSTSTYCGFVQVWKLMKNEALIYHSNTHLILLQIKNFPSENYLLLFNWFFYYFHILKRLFESDFDLSNKKKNRINSNICTIIFQFETTKLLSIFDS